MSYTAARARYAAATTDTASPAQLLTMLFDRLVTDLVGAQEAMLRKDIETTGDRIGHAQEILLELAGSLDVSVWPEGEPLRRLYLWLVNELMSARLKQDADRVGACRELVEPLRDSWKIAAASPEAQNLPGGGGFVDAAPAAATHLPPPSSSAYGTAGPSAYSSTPAAPTAHVQRLAMAGYGAAAYS